MSVIRCSHQRVSELFRCDAGHNQCGPLFRPLKTSGEQSPSDLHQTTLQTDHYRQLHSVFWASGPLFKWGSTKLDEFTHTCKPDWGGEGLANKTYALCLAFFAFAVPVGAMIYAYYKIYCIARASKRAAARYGPQKEESPQGERVPLKESTATKHTNAAATADDNKALKTVLLLIGSFAACWSIYTLATVWRILASNSVPPWIVRVGLVLTLCNCCIDPFIYSIRDEKMKREIKEMICKILCRNT